MSASARQTKFVKALLKSGSAARQSDAQYYRVEGMDARSLDCAAVEALVSQGVLQAREKKVVPTPETRAWLKRQLAEAGGSFSSQHRQVKVSAQNVAFNLRESPLARLCAGNAGFLQPHHVAAAARFQKLFERAALRQRTTMSYDPARRASEGSGNGAGTEISDLTCDARKQIDLIFEVLPGDCVGAIMDICGFEKRLQTVETERGWPRRSAKLVLRIALEQLAEHFGLTNAGIGVSRRGLSGWRPDDARPMAFGAED